MRFDDQRRLEHSRSCDRIFLLIERAPVSDWFCQIGLARQNDSFLTTNEIAQR